MKRLITVFLSFFILLSSFELKGSNLIQEFSRDPSEINLIVHDFFPALDQENNPLKLPPPLQISLIPILYSRITQHMEMVEDFLKSQANLVNFDENFRMLIWNLAKAKICLRRLGIEDRKLVAEIDRLLEKSVRIFSEKKMKTRAILAVTSAYELEENSYWIELLGLASSHKRRAQFALQYENETFSRPWPKDKERCGTTARALLFLFHRINKIPGLLTDGYHAHKKGIGRLKQEILKNHNAKKKRAIYWVDSAKLDHMFLIQQTSHRHYRIHQSFVNKYSFEENLAKGKNLTLRETIQFLDSIQFIESSHDWTEEIERAYEKLFLSKPNDAIIDDFNKTRAEANFVVKFYALSSSD